MIDLFRGESPKEECGVIGVFAPEQQAARVAFFGLFALQHRGQESAGIASTDGNHLSVVKKMGLVSQVFTEKTLKSLPGHMAVGHNRYSTTGSSKKRNAQPIVCLTQIGEIAVAHNGNLINAEALRKELVAQGETFSMSSDSEVIAKLLVRYLHEMPPEDAVAELMKRIKGAYSIVVLTPKMILGFRDPNGVRPLVAGRMGSGYLVASETCAFGPVGGVPEHHLEPGEMVIIDAQGMRFAQAAPPARKSMCLFEFIYFARPDSEMYESLLYDCRFRMGAELAKEHPTEADIVIPVPDSGVPAALGYAEVSGIRYREGMMKSRYIHRTFIQPDQKMRESGVRMKLSPLVGHIYGKRIVLVDDSIVRATTTKQIVRMLKEAGAKEVHVRITAPPIQWPCFYGIDMDSRDELAAAKWTIDQIREHIGADTLGYLSIGGAVNAVGRKENEFCLACFNGDYPIPVDGRQFETKQKNGTRKVLFPVASHK